MDSGQEYLISLHLDLAPYKYMNRNDAIKSIKQHCGIPLNYVSKYENSGEQPIDTNSKFTKDIISGLAQYMNIKTISEEEEVMSGSEEFYIDKWKCRPPYNNMSDTEAEQIIRSKLNIIHRDKNCIQEEGFCSSSCE